MTRPSKILAGVGLALAILALFVTVLILFIVPSAAFQDYVRRRIVSAAEESTGGKVQVRTFHFSVQNLTATITGFVIHGTEPAEAAPLFEAPEIVLRLKLFQTHVIDLQSLTVERPAVNLIVSADGSTNIPPRQVSGNSGLKTIVDLAVGHVDLNNGAIHVLDRSMPLGVHGDHLQIALVFNDARYTGNISMAPIYLASNSGVPLEARLAIPVEFGANSVRIAGAKATALNSYVILNGDVSNLAAPDASIQVAASVNLAEIGRAVPLPLDFRNVPPTLDAKASVQIHGNAVDVGSASASLGGTMLEVHGNLETGAAFSGNLDLNQISALLALNEKVSGSAAVDGTVRYPLDVSGNIRANGLSVTTLKNLDVLSSFHATPAEFDLTGFNAHALGGIISGDLQFARNGTLHAATQLRDFDIQTLAGRFTSTKINYSGAISAKIDATAKSGDPLHTLDANAAVTIAPKSTGIPVSGALDFRYLGSRDSIAFSNSQVQLPHSVVTLSGTVGEAAQLRVTSRNLSDFASLPVALRNGSATIVVNENGPIRDPQITGSVRATNFTVEKSKFDELTAGFHASPSRVSIEDGVLRGANEQAQFNGHVGLDDWKPSRNSALFANGDIRNGDLAGLLALAGAAKINATGAVNATFNVSGTIANPTGGAQLSIANGTVMNAPFDQIRGAADFSGQKITLRDFEINAPAGRIDAQGSYSQGLIQASASSTEISLSKLPLPKLLKQPEVTGTAQFHGDLVANWRDDAFTLAALNGAVSVQTPEYGSLTAQAATYGSVINTRVDSNLAGSATHATFQTKLAPPYVSEGSVVISHLDLQKLVPAVAAGELSANIRFAGTIASPGITANLELVRASLYRQALNSVHASVEYSPSLLNLASLKISAPAGNLEMHGTYRHDPSDLRRGRAELSISTAGIQLSRVEMVEQREPGLSGTFRVQGNAAVDVNEHFLPVRADITGGLSNVALDGRPLGDLSFRSQTSGNAVSMHIDSNLGKSAIHGNLQVALQGDYPATGRLTFEDVTLAAVRPFVPSIPANLHAVVDGDTSGSVPLMNPAAAQGQIALSRLELTAENVLTLRNSAAVNLKFDHSQVHVDHLRMEGPSTHIAVDGSVSLNQSGPVDLTLTANTDAAIAKVFDPNAFTAGSLDTTARIRGTLMSPETTGQIQVKDLSLQLFSWPTGIAHADGVIRLSGTDARIASLTAEAGGGKVVATGSAGFSGGILSMDLRVTARGVRARYSGASVSANADVTLTGTSQRSVLGGAVTITRVGYNQQSDIGSLLTASSTPPTIPGTSTGALAGMRLNVRIQTAPDVIFQTNLAQQLSGNADVLLEGTAATPGMVGRVNITAGTLVFFGNKYTVDRGTISFYNPVAIDPVLDINFQTFAQGVQVDIGVSGPIEDLKLSYRSDPPLRFEDIIALLAAGVTPPDPTIAVNQPYAPSQTATQMGESAILGAAVANPLASRLARVFGVNQISIAPSFVSGSVIPQARVTVQEQVNPNVTFTYTQDLTQTNSQLIRIEWALTPRFSAIATRDENGIFGVDFYYKLQFK